MAKCIRVVGQFVPVRMSDADAFQIVDRDHDGQYCPKSVWKRAYGEGERLIARLEGRNISKTSTLARNLQHSRG